MTDVFKVVHFSFLFICILLMSRIFFLSELSFSLLWILYAALIFVIIYFPFTSQALDFYRLPLEDKLHKYFKRIIIIDLIIGIIGSIPYLFCLISTNSECYVALLSIGIFFALATLIGVQIVTAGIIVILHGLEKISSKLKYVLFFFIILILIFLNIFTYLIPGSKASMDPNTFFEGTKQCEKLNIFNIPEYELSRIGCDKFYMFDENGIPKSIYRKVAPINAFRTCYYEEELSVGGGTILHYINCKERDKYGDKIILTNGEGIGSSVYSQSGNLPEIASYGFDQDDSYFDVCKIIITDYVNWKKKECLKS